MPFAAYFFWFFFWFLFFFLFRFFFFSLSFSFSSFLFLYGPAVGAATGWMARVKGRVEARHAVGTGQAGKAAARLRHLGRLELGAHAPALLVAQRIATVGGHTEIARLALVALRQITRRVVRNTTHTL